MRFVPVSADLYNRLSYCRMSETWAERPGGRGDLYSEARTQFAARNAWTSRARAEPLHSTSSRLSS